MTKMAFINGSSSADIIQGTNEADTIAGLEGDDQIDGLGGDDRLVGGPGHDNLYGDFGQDTIFGGTGDDNLLGGDGDDYLVGSEGGDFLNGERGADSLFGEDGDDMLMSMFDRFDPVPDLILDGGQGDDLVYLSLTGSSEQTMFELAPLDTGQVFNDTTIRNVERVYFNAAGEADRVAGGAFDDSLFGNSGDDVLFGRDGNDLVDGGRGSDRIFGGDGSDALNGGDTGEGLDNDTIRGEAGDDVIKGEYGADTLYGGAGADRFAFESRLHSLAGFRGRDVIQDFVVGSDKLDFSRFFTSDFEVVTELDGAPGQISLRVYSANHTMVVLDLDGDTKVDMQINVHTGGAVLTGDDFLL
jgi:Ca2+-binding RTX toxin-like protein